MISGEWCVLLVADGSFVYITVDIGSAPKCGFSVSIYQAKSEGIQ
jgi:hypothetical protein